MIASAPLSMCSGHFTQAFGSSAALWGDTLVVGAPLDDELRTDSGAVYVFERDQGGADNWGEVRKITVAESAGAHWYEFGTSPQLSAPP